MAHECFAGTCGLITLLPLDQPVGHGLSATRSQETPGNRLSIIMTPFKVGVRTPRSDGFLEAIAQMNPLSEMSMLTPFRYKSQNAPRAPAIRTGW